MRYKYLTALTAFILMIVSGCGGSGGSNLAGAAASLTSPPICPNGTIKTPTNQSPSTLLCDAPKLLSISPANNANDVSVDAFTGVVVTTDSPLDTTSINVDNIKLSASGVNVLGVVTTVGTNGLRFTPNTKLKYAQQYTFTASVKDILGKIFSMTINFSTATVVCKAPLVSNNTSSSCVNPIFINNPILLPDLKAKYDLLCGKDVHVQTAIPIDLNKDGKIDLVFTLWCPHKPAGENYIGSEPNTIVALIQTSPGIFVDNTKEIFGSDLVEIGGVSNGYLVTDLNNDGYEDLILTCMREDGRNPSDVNASNMKCQTVSFISDGKGKYNKISFGNPLWNEEVQMIKDKNGNKQIILIPNSYNAEIWSYNGQWSSVGKFSWMDRSPVFVPSPSANKTLKAINRIDSGVRFEVWNDINGNWAKVSDYNYIKKIQVDALDYSSGSNANSTFKINILNLDGQDYIDYAGVYEGCTLKRTKDSPLEVFYSFLGDPIVGGYKGGIVNYIWGPPVFKLIATGISDQSNTFQPNILISDRLQSNFYHMSCLDLNGDGLDDVLVRTSGAPFIYINDGTGKFGRLNPNFVPTEPNGSSFIYLDIDGDGINDLLYFPIDRWQYGYWISGANKVQFQLYKGNRSINQDDLIFSN